MHHHSQDLQGRVALITGAGSGIGKGIAMNMADASATIVIADLKLEAAQSVADEIEKTYQVKTMALGMDVSSEEHVQQGFAKAVQQLGKVDIVVNNAGIQTISSIVDFDFQAWQRLIAIHLHGSFLCTRECMRYLQKQDLGGDIVFIGSVHSLEASLNKSAYISAKHGMLGLMRATALEGAKKKIRAYLLAPGFVKTPLVDKQIPEQAKTLGISEQEVIDRIMLGETIDKKFTTIDEIAEIATYLCVQEAAVLSGQVFSLTHGWHMGN